MGFLDKMGFFRFGEIQQLYQTFQNLMPGKNLIFFELFLIASNNLVVPIAVLSEVTIGKSNEDPTNDCAAKLYTSSGLYFFIVCEMFD